MARQLLYTYTLQTVLTIMLECTIRRNFCVIFGPNTTQTIVGITVKIIFDSISVQQQSQPRSGAACSRIAAYGYHPAVVMSAIRAVTIYGSLGRYLCAIGVWNLIAADVYYFISDRMQH
jgi:hypothetical protein